MTKRIVLVLAAFPQLSESFIVSKFTSLVDEGWDVQIVCNAYHSEIAQVFPQLTRNPSITRRIHKNPPNRARWLAALLFPVVLVNTLVRNISGSLRYLSNGIRLHGLKTLARFYTDSAIIALKPDLIHFEFGATAAGRADIASLLGCKTIVSFRGYDLNFSGLDQPDFYKDVWRFADGFHFLGDDLRQRGLKRGCPPEKPFVMIPPAIDCDFFKPVNLKTYEEISASRPLRILSVGRLEWKKGYEFAFQAITQLLDAGVPCDYHIVGDGAYLEPLAFARHQLGLDEVVKFLGAQPREKVREELLWADLFLHAAVSEGFCNAVLEAQAMQVPVVCSDADGLSENVAHGVTGFVVPRRDPAALAERMRQLAISPELRERLGIAGRERVTHSFRLSDQVNQFEAFYQRILDRDGD
jgi:colanic acid/amylovoran biosynthesis glycosyltransferase